MLRSISNSFYNASSSFIRPSGSTVEEQDSSADDEQQQQRDPPRSILKKSSHPQFECQESSIKPQGGSVARNVTFSDSTLYSDSFDAQPLSSDSHLQFSSNHKEYSNLFDASLGPPQDSYAQDQDHQTEAEAEAEAETVAESSATVAPLSTHKPSKGMRASTTLIRSPPPHHHHPNTLSDSKEDSVYYTASKDHSHISQEEEEEQEEEADQSEAPDLESSPSHRPASRPRRESVPKLSLTQSSQQTTTTGLDKWSLSQVMDDSPVHESMRFEFSEVPEDPPLPPSSPQPQQSPSEVETSVVLVSPPSPPSSRTEPGPGRRSVSAPAVPPSQSQPQSMPAQDDVALATDLEALLGSQSDLIELNSIQRRTLISLAKSMRSHILTQATTISELKREKRHAEKGWTEAIDQVEAWEAQRQREGQDHRHLEERVEMQEAESRRQMQRSKEVEMQVRKKAQEDVQRVQQEMEEVQREHIVEFEVLKQAYADQANEAKDLALAELKNQLAHVEERHHSELARVRTELSGVSREELTSVQAQLDAAQSRVKELEVDVERESTARQRSDEAVQASQSQHQSLLSELEAMETAIAERDQFSEQLEREHESKAHDFRVEIDALRKRLVTAQDDLARAEEGATGQMDVLGRHAERIAALEEEIRVLSRQKEEADGEAGGWKGRCEALEGVVQEKHALQEEVDRLKATVGQLRMQSADTDVKVVRLQKQRQKLKAEVEDLQMGLDAKQIEIQFLKRKRSLRPSLAPTTSNASKTVSVSEGQSDLASVPDTPLPTTAMSRGQKGESTVKRDPAKPRRISFGAKPAMTTAAAASRRMSTASIGNKENSVATALPA